jgi:hypothetical protein
LTETIQSDLVQFAIDRIRKFLLDKVSQGKRKTIIVDVLEATYTRIVIKKFEKQYKNLDIVWIKELKRFALIEYRFSKIVLHLKEKVDHKWAGKFLTLKLSKASYSSLLR